MPNTPTPARPALDAMAMSEGDEPTPEAILIAAWKLRFNKAFRPEEEAGALMAFLDTVGLCVVSKRSLADMRGAIDILGFGTAKDAWLNLFGASEDLSNTNGNDEITKRTVARVLQQLAEVRAALARSAP